MNETMVAVENELELDIEKIREEYPMLKKHINGKQLIYLDSAATVISPNGC